MRQGIVEWGGRDDEGDLFLVTFNYPDAGELDMHASPAQVSAIERFYGIVLDPHRGEMRAHHLLSYRDYSEAVARRVFPRMDGERRSIVARFVAAYIGRFPKLGEQVVAWSESRFSHRGEKANAHKTIAQHTSFEELAEFAKHAVLDMRDAGSAL